LDFYNSLGDRFVAGGDFNAKHTHSGSRLVTPKGRQLYKAIVNMRNKLECVSPGSPTYYWPADPRKVPDLTDFAVRRIIPRNLIRAKSLLDLSSDHSPVLIPILQSPKIIKHLYRLTS